MSAAMSKAVAEYRRIADMFRNNDPEADKAWQEFTHAENGWSLAADVVQHPGEYA